MFDFSHTCLAHLPCTQVLCSNSEAIGKFRLELQFFLHLKKLSLVDFLEVVSQIATRTEGRVAYNANVISHPTVIQNMKIMCFQTCAVYLCCLRCPR